MSAPAFATAPLLEAEESDLGLPRRRHLLGPALTILAVDVVAVFVFAALSGFAFVSVQSLRDIALDGSEDVLLSIGVAFLLGAGELDISLGANVILSSVAGGEVMGAVKSPGPAIAAGAAACLLTGMAGGLFNALVVTRLRVNSFITTLASLGIMTGIAYVLTGGYNVSTVPFSLQTDFGIARLGGVLPYPSLIALVAALVAGWFLYRTRFGLHTLALGSSREAALRAGVKVRSTLAVLFVLAGGCAGTAGLIDLARYTTTNLSGHQTDALAAIAGAVIGGTNLYGGKVSIAGAVFGSLLAVILQDGLVVIGLPAFYQLIAVGVVLIVAVSLRSFGGAEGAPGVTSQLASFVRHRKGVGHSADEERRFVS
jgi:ribose transport system permease protein